MVFEFEFRFEFNFLSVTVLVFYNFLNIFVHTTRLKLKKMCIKM